MRLGAPLALAALGETMSERAGVINIGLEGSIIGGALGGALGALLTGSPGAGVLAGAAAGTAITGVFALFAITLNADQIIVGTAVTLGGLGITGVVYQSVFGATGTALTLPTLPALPLPGLSALPALGPALFSQAWTTYLAYLVAPALWYYLFRTRWGLELRAAGEEPDAGIGDRQTVGVEHVTCDAAGQQRDWRQHGCQQAGEKRGSGASEMESGFHGCPFVRG